MEAIDAHDEPFIPGKPRYNQATFSGRFKHFLDVADPRCLAPKLFFGMSLEESIAIIDRHDSKKEIVPMNELWLASKIKMSTIHPDTNEAILPPLRMCGFAVFGTPIVIGMLIPNPSLAATIFWQSLNQTHNAGVNFANRNASSATSVSQIAQGYAGALVSSVGLAVGLNHMVKRAKVSTATRTLLSRFVPYPAVAAASTINMLLMRRSELETGIDVMDSNGVVHGKSKEAARRALTQTALSRLFLPMPLLVTPPLVMMLVDRSGVLRRVPRMRVAVEALVCVTSFVFGLPLAISLFPQYGEIGIADLEPEFAALTDTSTNKPITTLTYNKGL